MKMNAEGMTNHLDDEKHLMNLTLLVNKAAYAVLGCRDSCILTSHAFHHVLSKMGGDAKLTRVTCGVFPEYRNLMANVLGSRGDGSRRPAAEPGMWNGHLVVTLNNKWLLDATLDQANKPDWPEDIHVHPVVVRLKKKNSGKDARYSGKPEPRCIAIAFIQDKLASPMLAMQDPHIGVLLLI
jgi:hypothetical protein